jgi:hypothetical protein
VTNEEELWTFVENIAKQNIDHPELDLDDIQDMAIALIKKLYGVTIMPPEGGHHD